MANHWSTAQRLGLVLAEPHVRLRAKDAEGKPYLVEILTWRDEDIPDNAPAEILGVVEIDQVELEKPIDVGAAREPHAVPVDDGVALEDEAHDLEIAHVEPLGQERLL